MDLTSPKIIKELMVKQGVKPNKILGQNFLIDKNILEKIIDSADLKPTDVVLEVGPGIGALTKELSLKAGKIIAVEKDKNMVEVLKKTLSDYKNIKIINGDILKIKNYKIKNYKVVANIPYYLTSPLIRKFLESANPPSEMILMIQKEVAQRICSKPPDMSLLAVSVQFYAEPKIISYVSKNCFLPAPKIDSAIIKITPRRPTSREAGSRTSPDLFFRVVKAGFSHPRKQIAGNLAKNLKIDKKTAQEWLKKNSIDSAQRAETLSVEDWKNLTNSFSLNHFFDLDAI